MVNWQTAGKLLTEAGKAAIRVGKTWEAEHTRAKLRGAEEAVREQTADTGNWCCHCLWRGLQEGGDELATETNWPSLKTREIGNRVHEFRELESERRQLLLRPKHYNEKFRNALTNKAD